MSYTKGEWERWSSPNGYHIWAGDVHIADVGDREDPEQSANAYLMAASKEMYAACKAALESLTHLTMGYGETGTIKTLRQAITKAEGKKMT